LERGDPIPLPLAHNASPHPVNFVPHRPPRSKDSRDVEVGPRSRINQQLALWVPFAVIFPLLFFHHSRSLWLALDHFFNPATQLFSVPPKKNN
jgi:hypothetical protein